MVVPLCRCRVLHIGSAVPTVTKDGLQGIQQPLRERYPIEDSPETRGIDSWLSVWSNGILLEYIEGDQKSETCFFPINSLHYCAAVRYVNVSGYAIEGGGERFLPLDSPFADIPDSPHPPMFAAIMRRTNGVKVLECHGFICTNSKAANALVKCCFHAYADCMHLKLDDKNPGLKAIKEGSVGDGSPASPQSEIDDSADGEESPGRPMIQGHQWSNRQQDGDYDSVSISSSMVKGEKKANSESGGARNALLPFGEGPRRIGSDPDLPAGDRRSAMGNMPMHPRFHPGPPPGMMPPPGMIHPPFGMYPPPPPFFAGGPHRPPPPPFMMPPHMRGPPGGRPMFPPPPPFHHGPPFPPPRGFPFFPPPPAFPMGGHHYPMGRHSPSSPTDGPIITGPESVYGTIPRRYAHEEPNMYSGMNGGVPESSYHPANYDGYETYYDTLKKKTPKGSGSVSSREGPSSVWEQYEAGIYRKPHLHEKAFSNTLRSKDLEGTMSRTEGETSSQTVRADVIRPDTPPADYEAIKAK